MAKNKNGSVAQKQTEREERSEHRREMNLKRADELSVRAVTQGET